MQVQSERIPQYLKDKGRFCNWKYELRNGKQTKVPYTPGTPRRASVSDPATFAAFESAASATGYDGIGIRVCDRIVGIDLDHCIVDGKPLPWAQEIVDRFAATYIEVSPSGTGIRIFCLLPDGFTYDIQTYYIKKGNIEVYIPGHTNRFLTITGNALTDADVVETADALAWLLDTHMRRPTPPTPTVAVPGESYLTDDAVIAKASAAHNGEKFRRLWDGDITGYKSRSEADAALLSILAFWCSGDTAQMDRLFRQSGLMREKWDSFRGADTYGNISMQKAVTRMTDFYKPITTHSAAEDFGAERLRELDPMDSSRYPWNDIGAGHIFADFYQDCLRYVPERKLWFHYEGGIWKADTGSLRAMKYCMELADLMYTFTLEIRDEDKRKSYMKYASRWQSHTNRVNILKDAQVYHGRPAIVESEAEIVRLIYRLFLDGKSQAAICKELESLGIPSPAGKPTWSKTTVNSILQNEKYKGDALLQKKFTVDFLEKKMKPNEGEVPQYYVENSHPAIIGPDEWDHVQAELARRKSLGRAYSGKSVFSAKLVCEECGNFFGSKVWHSTDQYRRTIWQCNGKFSNETRCHTPTLNTNTIQRLFIQAYNQLMFERKQTIADCELARKCLTDFTTLDAEIERQLEESQVIAEMVKAVVKENASTAQSQEAYLKKYETLTERYEKAATELERLQSLRTARSQQDKKMALYIRTLKKQPEVMHDWNDTIWTVMIEKAIVHRNGEITFAFANGTEIKVGA